MARPKKEATEVRGEIVRTRLTMAERAFVETQARTAGVDPAEYLRRRLLGHHVSAAPSRADAKLLAELNRLGLELKAIGNNVNQIARAANSDRDFHGSWDAAYDRLEETRAEVRRVIEGLAVKL